MKVVLRCAGCSRVIVDEEPGQILAISCTCGAMSPILLNEAGGVFSCPASLVTASSKGQAEGHLEYYLGFSDYKSEMKSRLEQELLDMGFTSMSDCGEDSCKAVLATETARFAKTHYGINPLGWRFEEVKAVFGEHHQDHFCVGERFDVSISNGLPGMPDSGWHLTIAPRCAHKQNSIRVGEGLYMPEVETFFKIVGCTFTGPIASEMGLDAMHFHQLPIPKPGRK